VIPSAVAQLEVRKSASKCHRGQGSRRRERRGLKAALGADPSALVAPRRCRSRLLCDLSARDLSQLLYRAVYIGPSKP
jgi:hypothetical protein